MAPRNFFTKKKLFYGSGLLATMFGALYVYFPDVVEMGVRSQVNIQEGNQIYPNWIKFPVAVETRFTFFEVENPEDALRGAKVRVHERGPYCFKQYRRKKIIWFSEDKRRVKYYEYKVYQEDNQSEGCQRNWDEKFSVINAPVAALGGTIGDLVLDKIPLPGVTSPVIFGTVNTFLASHRQNLFMKRSPREIILGYKVNLLETIASLVKPLEALGIKGLLPENGPKDNVFGLLYGRNNTPEGPYEMWTGVGDSTRNYSMFISWKDSRKLKFWGGDRCNRVLGGDGTGFPPFLTKNNRIYVFNPDACRAIPFDYIKDNEFKGIPVLRFGISEEFFNSPDRDPMNECFCMHKKRRYRCQQNGAYDLGGCQAGAPILLTKPHFLNTDPDLSQLVEGLSPNPELHEGFLEVEPFTGGGVNAMGKLQFGLRVEKIPFLRGFNSIRNAVIPLVWIQEGAGLPDNLADQLRNQLIGPVKGASIGIAGIAGTSLVLFVIIGLMILMGKNEQTGKNNEKKEKSGNEKSQDQKPATIEPKIDSYQSPPPSMMAQDFSQSNGLLPIMGQFNQRRAIASLPFQANNTNAIQPMMRARWDGLLLHPGQYNFGFNGNLGMINGAQPAIFVPISPDIMVDYQSSRGTQMHRLSAVSDGYQSDTESLPPLENMPRSSLRSRSAGDGIKRESRSSSTSPRPNSLPNANRSLESRYFNDTVSLIDFR